MNRRTIVGRVLLGLAALFLAAFFYEAVLDSLLSPFVELPSLMENSAPLFLLFSLFHALYALGWLHASILLVGGTVFFWAVEQIGVSTGAIFGAYYYTDVLGPMLGNVPIIEALAWFAILYPCYAIANSIADGRATGSRGGPIRIAWLALLSGMVTIGWDSVIDPYMTAPEFGVEAWVWENPGPYFSIPFQAFVGILVTTTLFYFGYRWIEKTINLRPIGQTTTIGIEMMPALAYGFMAISYILAASAGPLRVIAIVAMGTPVVAAIGRLYERRLSSG